MYGSKKMEAEQANQDIQKGKGLTPAEKSRYLLQVPCQTSLYIHVHAI
jgi:hypothetical protein